ncbi:MAG: anaerobic ribonucleoside triphosphate reductase, partial [Clostridiales bacterium]|nr:anaerobic ribonucleoside triphosphate reductase [Clostridiales bacterium]
MIDTILKRDGREVPFDPGKITSAILKAFQASGSAKTERTAQELTNQVLAKLGSDESIGVPTVEQIQDAVEGVLIENGFVRTAKRYILYRAERSRIREMNTRLMQIYDDITNKAAKESDIKRENANINGDTAMGAMLKYGAEGAKQFNEMFILKPEHAQAHHDGDIHIHDMDFLTLTTTCCQIDLLKLFHGGFSTGHGYLREPKDIVSYSALACIAIQANQNDQHGGQSVVNFDYAMAEGVRKTFRKRYRDNLARALELTTDLGDAEGAAAALCDRLRDQNLIPTLQDDAAYRAAERAALIDLGVSDAEIERAQAFAHKKAVAETDRASFQAMEALIHNLNTMNSRAGAQVPFSSINYGMDT